MLRYSLIVCSCFLSLLAGAQQSLYEAQAIHHPVISQHAMVSTQHYLATDVGIKVLQDGGNAIDAAVAVGFALAVVLPRAGNLGGGGFMLYYDADADTTLAVNYREKAPQKARATTYQDNEGEVIDTLYNHSHYSVGVPGTVAGLLHMHKAYGSLPLEKLLAPAIDLAKTGFPLQLEQAEALGTYKERLSRSLDGQAIFTKNGNPYQQGDTLLQRDLAQTIQLIANEGADAFYTGAIAQKIVAEMLPYSGWISPNDLATYEVEVFPPVEGNYKGYKVVSMPPPSSGGVHLIQILNILEALAFEKEKPYSAESIRLMVEAMKYAYADRSQHLGDPLFVHNPVRGLTSKDYARDIADTISRYGVRSASDIRPGSPKDYESEETTHFSIVDAYGNVVSNTYTLNFSYGSGIVARGTGILLNNEMGDFTAKVGAQDAYGLVGSAANAIAAGKTPLSSMTPTIVFKDGKPWLVTGSPGGSRIITTVLQIVLSMIHGEGNIAEVTHAPRIHHQWQPDILYYERALNPDTRHILEQMGYTLEPRPAMGSTQSILIHKGHLEGCSDPRRDGGLTRGY